MPDDGLNLRALANLTDRDKRLLRALADVGLAPSALVQRAFFGAHQAMARKRLRQLAERGLVLVLHVDPASLPGAHRGARLLALTAEGAEAAEAQGAQPLVGQALRAAAVLSPAVVAVAEAYVTLLPVLEGGGTWSLRPDLPQRGGKAAPDGAWSLARSASGREAVVFDLDLPGRTFSQVESRLRGWAAYRSAGGPQVCYVTPDDARRKRVAELSKPLDGVETGHPSVVAKRVFFQS